MSKDLGSLDSSVESYVDCDEENTLHESSEEDREVVINEFYDPSIPQMRSSTPTGTTPPAGSFVNPNFSFEEPQPELDMADKGPKLYLESFKGDSNRAKNWLKKFTLCSKN